MKSKMKQIAILILTLFFSVACSNVKKDKDVIKIGAILPLTGDLSSYGVDTKLALELAVKHKNNNGGINGKKVVLVIEDSKGQTKEASIAANKLINIDKVIAILGPITSPEVLVIAPICNKNKVPLISPSSTDNAISNAGEYVFRTINADNIETQAFAIFLKQDLNLPKIAIIANQATGTLSYANSFEDFYKKNGGTILNKEIFGENQIDFKNIIIKLLSSKPDAFYISGVSMELGLLIKQIREFNKTVMIFSYQSAEDRRVVEIANEQVNGVIFSSTTLPDSIIGSARLKFVDDFMNEYGKKPGIFAAEIFDGINIIMNAFNHSNDSNNSFIEILKTTKDYNGASGIITFDVNGDVHKNIAIYQYHDKKPALIATVTNNSIQKVANLK